MADDIRRYIGKTAMADDIRRYIEKTAMADDIRRYLEKLQWRMISAATLEKRRHRTDGGAFLFLQQFGIALAVLDAAGYPA